MGEADSEKPLATKSTILTDSLDVGDEFKKRFNDGWVGRDPITVTHSCVLWANHCVSTLLTLNHVSSQYFFEIGTLSSLPLLRIKLRHRIIR